MPVRRRHVAMLVAALLQATGMGPIKAEDPHLGLTEYELSCMPCHGIDGRGDGLRAKSLKTAPADLTKIAKSNGGVFPAKKVTEIIDGRATVAAHGQREMPVWGDRYRVRVDASERTAMIERRADTQIAALVQYLRTIQEK
jgi:mono/diheme cytochrome c family protein